VSGALLLTYHGVENGPPPLFVEPALLREHLDCLLATGAAVLTVREVAAGLREGGLPQRAVALTFDDAFASVVEHAAPLMAERDMRATVFAVVGRLGGTNTWSTQPSRVPQRRLAGADDLRQLAEAGWEIGSHGFEHLPLSEVDDRIARRELIDSRTELEQRLGRSVTSFAAPYGAAPTGHARRLLEQTYAAGCSGGIGRAVGGTDPWALPRVDAHYLRSPERLRRAARGGLARYLACRRVGAGMRRRVVKDYVKVPPR
jgi:peptidoglycan/xylan/chitin deacetylase (PgdA/CDA1 family)